MMMKRFFALVVIAAGIASCRQPVASGKFTVDGTLKNAPDQKVYLEQLFFSNQAPQIIDSTTMKGGKFTVSATAPEEGFYRLKMEQLDNGFLFINDAGNISFTGDAKDMTLKGADFSSVANKDLKAFISGLDSRRETFETTANRIKKLELHADNDSALTAEKQKIAEVNKEANEFIIQTVNKAKSPVVALFALGYSQKIDTGILNKSVPALEKRFPSHTGVAGMVATYKQMVAQAQQQQPAPSARVKTGSVAPVFTMNDTAGKPFSLTELKGKYVLVDFWASWCGPCRAENPNVVAAYQKYKSKNFTVLGVSLDDNKATWLKAIRNDKLDWKHVSDLKGWENATCALYGFNAIPYNVLLDPEGRIIATELRGAALEEKLASVLH